MTYWTTLYQTGGTKSHLSKYSKCPKYPTLYSILFWLKFCFFMGLFLKNLSGMANSVDPDQTAPSGAFWSGSTLFAYHDMPFCQNIWCTKFYDIYRNQLHIICLSCNMRKHVWHVCPSKTRISLCIRAVWSESLFWTWIFASLAIQNVPSEDIDQTARNVCFLMLQVMFF